MTMVEQKQKAEKANESENAKKSLGQIIKKGSIQQMLICLVVLGILAVAVNIGIPALNEKQLIDDLDFNTRLVDKAEPRSVDGGTKGHLIYGPGTMMMPGDYTLWLYYSTDTDTNYVDISTPDGVIYKETLLKNKTVHRIDFTYDMETRLDCRVWYSGEGHLSVDHVEIRRMRRDLQMVQYALDALLLLIFAGYLGYFLAKLERKKRDAAGQNGETCEQIPWKTRIKKSVPVALFISFTFFVAGPIGLYLSNTSEFWFSLGQMLPILVVAFLSVAAIITIILSIFPGKLFPWTLAVAFGMGVGLYIEDNFLVRDYGLLNGSEIAWGTFAKWAVIDTLAWVAIIAASLLVVYFSRKWADKVIRYGSILLATLQAVALVITAATTPDLTGKSDYLLTTKNLSKVSSDENILVFVLDTFDVSFMTDFLAEHPEYKDKLSDFVFYPNTSTYGVFTHIAIPHILTNVVHRNEVSESNYEKLAFQYAPIYDALVEHNYDVGIYSSTYCMNYINPDKERQSIISNLYEGKPQISSQMQFLRAWIDLTAFRSFPHILKENFQPESGAFNILKGGSNGQSSYHPDSYIEPYIQLQEPLELESGKNAFRFYHTMGTHAGSVVLNEKSEEVGSTRTTLNQHIMGLFYVIDSYINQLKENGVYENSSIIIMADHGGIGAYNNALLMVKPKQYSGPFTISNAPISFTDLLPTFLELLGEDGSQYGRSIFEIGEDEQRTRYFYRDMKCDDGVSRVIEFRSDGDAGDAGSWVQVGPALDQLSIEVEPVSRFDTESQMYTVLLSNEATRHYQLSERPGDDLQVDLTLYSLTDRASHLVAYADGAEVFNGSVDPSGSAAFALPDGVLADDVVELRFEFPEENESAAHLIALNFAAKQ